MKMTKNEEIKALKIIIKSTEKFIKEEMLKNPGYATIALTNVQYHLAAVTQVHFHQPSLPEYEEEE